MKNINNKGQTLVEYVLIISIITVIAVSLVKTFGGYLKDSMTKTSCSLVGEKFIEGKKVGEGYCEGDKPVSESTETKTQ